MMMMMKVQKEDSAGGEKEDYGYDDEDKNNDKGWRRIMIKKEIDSREEKARETMRRGNY